MIALTRRYRFCASHRLHVAHLSSSENARLYGKCNNPFGHGHNYVLSVTVAGTPDKETGILIQRDELHELVSRQVLDVFANRNFNLDVPEFSTLVPTTENIAQVIAEKLQRSWASYVSNPAARLSRIHVQETDRNGFEVLIGAREERTTVQPEIQHAVNA